MAPSRPVGFDSVDTAKTKTERVVNIIAVVVDALPPKKSGGSSSVSTFTLKDEDFASDAWYGLKIRYFSNDESFLPDPQLGDVVLLRTIRIRSYQGAIIGLSSQRDLIPWVIFRKGSNQKAGPWIIKHPQATDPNPSERAYALFLMGGGSAGPDRQSSGVPPPQPVTTTPAARTVVVQKATAPVRTKFSLIKDLAYGTFVDLIVQVVKTYPEDYQRFQLYVTDYTENKQLFNYSEDSHSRDGDEFNYTTRPKRDWLGPMGQMTLQVTLWEPHSHFARQNVKENDILLLQNVNVKIGRMSSVMEGSLHTDRHYPEKVQVIPIDDNDSDEQTRDLVKRKIEYWKRIKGGNGRFGDNGNKRKANPDTENLSRNAKKKLAQQRRKQEAKEKKNKRDDDQPQIATSIQVVKRDELNTHSTKTFSSITLEKANLSHLVRAQKPTIPFRSISNILTNPSHQNTAPSGIEYTLPFQNVRYRASIRVVDFFPPNLEDFAVQYDVERAMLSDDGSSGSGDSENEDDEPRRKKWEWRFCLLVEDGGPGTHYNRNEKRERMMVYVADRDAECLLRLDAVDLRANPDILTSLREKLFILWGDLEERKSANPAAFDINESSGKPSTRPFECCIKEFGVRSRKGESGDGFGWERRFRMYGTTIM
ncbi:hypothetical protein FQN55_009348 [Onygenales sp. PD_40]|nr:hypothetical protein FQN55_009348 [Onygenales sp. PD_40]